MAWQLLTEADVLTRVSGEELTRFRGASLAAGQPDPLPRQIEIVASFIRGYVFRCAANQAGAAALPGGIGSLGNYTLPESLFHLALDLLVPVIQKRVGGLLVDPDDLRKNARSDAHVALEKIARCEFQVDERWPIQEPETVAGPQATPQVTPRPLRAVAF